MAKVGGWSQLATKYRSDGSFNGPWRGWQWGVIGFIAYKHALWLGVGTKGLYMQTGPFLWFGPFHPPLCIPWSAIKSVEEREYFWRRILELSLIDSEIKIKLERNALPDAGPFLGDKLKIIE